MTIEHLQPTGASNLQVAQFAEVVNIIRTRRNELLQAANKALLDTYWQVGKYISKKIEQSAWGDSIVSQLAAYIAKTAPDLKGFSDKNLWRMKRFYETYVGDKKLSPLVREIGWTQNILIMSRCDNATEREFYVRLAKRDRLTKRELDRDVKKPQENPSIGVLLCQDKDDEVVQYALSRSLSPALVAKYQLCLPDKKLLQKKMREIFNDTEGGKA